MNNMKQMKPAWIVGIFIISIFTFYQCTNDEDLFSGIPGEIDFATLQEVHDSMTVNDTVELQIMDPTIENILEGTQQAVAPFTVKLIEIFKRGDMIRHNIQTFAAEDPLVSGGMFWVNVTDAAGTELQFTGVQAILPRQTDAAGYENSMEYFTGV